MDLLLDLCRGKRVAIVGSSPTQRGSGLGEEIDAHDVVIRQNSWSHRNLVASDIGRRASLVIINNDVRQKMVRSELGSASKIVGATADTIVGNATPCDEDETRELAACLAAQEVSFADLTSLFRWPGGPQLPNLGVLAFHYIVRHAAPAAVSVYGMSFYCPLVMKNIRNYTIYPYVHDQVEQFQAFCNALDGAGDVTIRLDPTLRRLVVEDRAAALASIREWQTAGQDDPTVQERRRYFLDLVERNLAVGTAAATTALDSPPAPA